VTGSKTRPYRSAVRVALALLGVLALATPALSEVHGPRQQAQQLISELEAKTEQRSLVDGPLTRARAALNRANQARHQKQLEQASVLERIALGWAQLGQLLVKTATLEADAAKLETTQNDLDTRLKRARALLEETLARRARAQETLKKLEPPPPAAAAPAAAQPAATQPAAGAAPAAPAAPAQKAAP
jgi:chromosome segregation ATPase